VLIDHTNGRVLEVLESREKTVVMQWLQAGVNSGLLAALEEVTTDMWDGYVEAAKEVFGERVRITIDRFHVMANFQQGLTDARREIQRVLPKEAAGELKGTRWKWLTNEDHLTEEDRRILSGLKAKYPLLAQLAQQRETLRAIFEDRTITTGEAGVARLRAWCQDAKTLGLKALIAFTKTLEHWIDKIANYFVSRSTNAQTEGYNHGLRAILWRAFGMRNFTHFRTRVLQAFG
jgi:transposase